MHELVHIAVYWHEEQGAFRKENYFARLKDHLWFKVAGEKAVQIPVPTMETVLQYKDCLIGSITFKPLPAPEYLATPYVSEIDAEMQMVGVEEAFGAGDDVEVLGTLAYGMRERLPHSFFYVDFYALYDVFIYHSHDESDTEYYLKGILDYSLLPSILEAKTSQ